jgi:hypothetical protein
MTQAEACGYPPDQMTFLLHVSSVKAKATPFKSYNKVMGDGGYAMCGKNILG